MSSMTPVTKLQYIRFLQCHNKQQQKQWKNNSYRYLVILTEKYIVAKLFPLLLQTDTRFKTEYSGSWQLVEYNRVPTNSVRQIRELKCCATNVFKICLRSDIILVLEYSRMYYSRSLLSATCSFPCLVVMMGIKSRDNVSPYPL